ncbi:MAG: alpha/beta hydrolase [Armatimonadota bacterium]
MRLSGDRGIDRSAAEKGRITARPEPAPPEARTLEPGQHRLGLDGRRDGLLYLPASYRRDRPAPFALLLHGAGGNAEHGLSLLRYLAEDFGLVLLAVDSRGRTWDVLLDEYGPDVLFINAALEHAFSRCAVDPCRVAIGGFSDGASYALSLGIGNGDLFSHVVAFSPGFMAPPRQEGAPRIYISHGIRDDILRIDPCSRRIVPQLERAGYDVRYREFDGPHTIPPEISREAAAWLTAGSP